MSSRRIFSLLSIDLLIYSVFFVVVVVTFSQSDQDLWHARQTANSESFTLIGLNSSLAFL